MKRPLKRAIRQLTLYPGFSAVVVLTLALSIGIATTVFSLFDAVLLRPFPYPNAEQIVRIHTYKQQFGNYASEASIYDFWDWKKRNRTFEGLAAYVSVHTTLTGSSEAAQVLRTTATSPELFKVLGTQPLLGRTFTRAENEFNGDVRKVVLSYGLWQGLFAGERNALNRVIQRGGESYTIIGIMPPGFTYPDRTQAWTPLMAMYSANADAWWKLRDIRNNAVVGRLKRGASGFRCSIGHERRYVETCEGVPSNKFRRSGSHRGFARGRDRAIPRLRPPGGFLRCAVAGNRMRECCEPFYRASLRTPA